MEFEVYCDEAHPDVLTSASPRARHLMIGSLWLPAELRGEIKSRIHALRQRHSAWGEIKWTKVSRNIGKIRAAALWERETCLAALERRGGR